MSSTTTDHHGRNLDDRVLQKGPLLRLDVTVGTNSRARIDGDDDDDDDDDDRCVVVFPRKSSLIFLCNPAETSPPPCPTPVQGEGRGAVPLRSPILAVQ